MAGMLHEKHGRLVGHVSQPDCEFHILDLIETRTSIICA
jgi:hypothetical protein